MDFPDPTFQGEYSWAYHAASQGYATLAIDNLGNGQSERPDPVEVVQGPLQLSILHNIIQGLRAASIKGIPTKYDKVVMACHSYGSVLGRLVATFFPTNGADAYILTAAAGVLSGLTGFINDTQARSASAIDPRFPHLAPAYVAVAKEAIRSALYSLDGSFDPKMEKFDADSPHVFAVGEIASPPPVEPSAFTGPVLFLTGRRDQIACGDGNIFTELPDCGVGPTSIPANASSLFEKSSHFDAYVPLDTAHNVNTHFEAPHAFGAAHAWLQTVGF
jgi:pimeloyl-ACP methyl ester carboxylesterase